MSVLCGFAQVASTLGVRAKRSAGATVCAVNVFVKSARVEGVRVERALSARALFVRVVCSHVATEKQKKGSWLGCVTGRHQSLTSRAESDGLGQS